MELTATSPQLQKCAAGQTSGCAINNTAKGGDLKFVGVASSAPQAIADGAPEDSMMGFGIATYANWANIGVNTVPFVDIDVDGGAPDYETFVYRVSASDILEAWTVELTSGDYNVVDIEPVNMAYGDFDTNTFDTNVIVMPVWLQALGIDASTDTTARFRYFVGVDSYYAAPDDALVDFIPSLLTYDPLRPGLWAEGDGASIMYIAEPGTGVQINRRTASTNLDHTDSVLVLNLHNPTATRATVVNVKNTQAPAPTRGARAS
jgi:hypothetical protein